MEVLLRFHNQLLRFQTARMKTLLSAVFTVLAVQAVFGVDPNEHNKVVCYWNSTAYERQGETVC